MVSKLFSKLWNSSTQKRKQRKYLHNAPLHIKHKLMSAHLSKELKKEHGVRSVPLRKGDTVIIKSGQFKAKSGKVEKVSLARGVAYVENASINRADGTKASYPLHPSNLEIIKLDLDDKTRVTKIKKMTGGVSKK